ncbi:glutathione S-transferase N-terminal domain-containing protein, partial [Vibrio alfacsensis]|uniref:glutathione S-transferase N-terminal domain-containing protein n=1 Tax=Vibrio alfacsensis TaxID=1074311 RepID=UPI004067C386
LHRPELFRLLDIAMAGDIILVEQVDRISRLNTKDWEQLKNIIGSKQVPVFVTGSGKAMAESLDIIGYLLDLADSAE